MSSAGGLQLLPGSDLDMDKNLCNVIRQMNATINCIILEDFNFPDYKIRAEVFHRDHISNKYLQYKVTKQMKRWYYFRDCFSTSQHYRKAGHRKQPWIM